jgi:hypothetical protein
MQVQKNALYVDIGKVSSCQVRVIRVVTGQTLRIIAGAILTRPARKATAIKTQPGTDADQQIRLLGARTGIHTNASCEAKASNTCYGHSRTR